MSPAAAKRLRLLASAVSVLVVVALAAGGWFYSRLRASLPQLDGAAPVAGLGAAVTVERDALGVPTIRGQSRADVSRALGWLHGQDRFFQMDLLRRSAAGELAELFGKQAVPRDRAHRIHGFRTLAQTVLARLPAEQRALIEAYAAGVNAGLAALAAKPFEYYALRTVPQPWRPEDTILVSYAMSLDMEGGTGGFERTLLTLRDRLGPEALAFFAPPVAPDDAALDGSTAPLPPIPGPSVLDLRARQAAAASGARARDLAAGTDLFPSAAHDPEAVLGSNAMALTGSHTATGAGLLASDMHLSLGVPNTWYRASLEFPSSAKAPEGAPGHKITGVTLPGTPLVIVGSNGHIAWGFTVSFVDTMDLVVVEMAPGLDTWYVTPGSPDTAKIEVRRETIRVKGGKDVIAEYRWTKWGPIVGQNDRGKPLALHWVAHDPDATNLNLLALEDATDVAAAVAVAHRSGQTALNLVVADAAGGAAWTIAGRVPRRVGYDGRLPVSWAYGDRRWEGLLPADEVPAIIAPPNAAGTAGRIWSANARAVGGAALATLGDKGYARPNRAAQVRDGILALERATPRDLLAVQLDDRALFLTPWHRLLLDTLTPAATAANKFRTALRAAAEPWEGRASVEALSYPIVRQFRAQVYERVFAPVFAGCIEDHPGFNWRTLRLEPALWAMVREKPAHLLAPKYATWDDLLLAAADDVIAGREKDGVPPAQATWGRRNTARIRHPFGQMLPLWLTGWLNMPADPLAGDNDMPRAQTANHGPSERLVVSPGRESEGIFHMPGGQSGHPLSPYFRAGHTAWVRGEPTPFLPGPAAHTLTLRP